MSKLEMILGTALVGVTTGYVYTVVGVLKHIKKEQQFLEDLQEKCNKIKNVIEHPDDVRE